MEIQVIEKPEQSPMRIGDGYNNSLKMLKAYRVVDVSEDEDDQGAKIGDLLLCFGPGHLLNITQKKMFSFAGRNRCPVLVVRAFDIKSITLLSDQEDRPA